MAAASRGRPSVSAVRMAVDDTSRPAIASRGAMVVAKPSRVPSALQIGGLAGAALAEAEIRADDDMADPQPLGQHLAREVFGRQRRQAPC